MSGRDLIGVAPTGSGKTLAYLVPMFEHCKVGLGDGQHLRRVMATSPSLEMVPVEDR
jgi:superfamily II DNA/RNA helicase